MKLRVRFVGRRELIELSNADETTLVDVKETVSRQLSLSSDSFQLSLDGKTPLPKGDSSTLKDMGIVGGDLLHVMMDEGTSSFPCTSYTGKVAKRGELDEVNQELLEQLLQMGFPKETALRALQTTKSTSINEALDILNREQPSTSDIPRNTKESCHLGENTENRKENTGNRKFQNEKDRVMEQIGNHCSNTSSDSTDSIVKAAGTKQSSHEESPKLQKIEYTPKALLCRDGIPYSLQMCYEQALITTLHEAVCIAIHVLMLETGFVTHSTQKSVQEQSTLDKGPSTSKREGTDPSSHHVSVVPDNWRTNCGAKFEYVHPACPGLTCSLVCTSLGPYVLAHGVYNSPSCNEVHQCRLPAADFVKGNVDLRANISSAADVYRNLQRLSLSVKDQIAYPLLSSMRHELNLEEIYGFMALPTEVKNYSWFEKLDQTLERVFHPLSRHLKLMVLCLLPVKCVLNVSSTCREMYALANDPTLWQHLCFRDFGLLTKRKYSSWKKEYRRYYKDMLEKERNRQLLSQAQRYYDHPGVYNPYPPPFNPPGILGGRHDLFPNVPYVPGGIHPLPGSLPQPGNLPRPRHDPFGPVPDMDIIPGSRRHPPGRGRGRGGFPPGPFF